MSMRVEDPYIADGTANTQSKTGSLVSLPPLRLKNIGGIFLKTLSPSPRSARRSNFYDRLSTTFGHFHRARFLTRDAVTEFMRGR